jgi:hypothetical protein
VDQCAALLSAQVVQGLQAQGIELDLLRRCTIAHRVLDQSVVVCSPFKVEAITRRQVEEFRDPVDGGRIKGAADAALHSAELAGVQSQVVCDGLLEQSAANSQASEGARESKHAVSHGAFSRPGNVNFFITPSYEQAVDSSTATDLSASDFRVMPIATWFPAPHPVEGAHQDRVELSAADFRVAFKAEFQRQLMRALFVEIQSKTGDKTIKDVVRRFSAFGGNEAELRAWYARARGERIPRPETLRMLRRSVPGIRLDIYHPMLNWLSTPDLDARTIRRLKAQMPAEWQTALNVLKATPTDLIEASPSFVRLIGLDRMGYLDALMLFASDRCLSRTTPARRVALNRILWVMPVLYPDDPLWLGCDTRLHRERHRWLLTLIDHALGLLGPDSPAQAWDGHERVVLMLVQHGDLRRHREAHPQACRTPLARRRYWAKIWRFCDAPSGNAGSNCSAS